MNWPLWILVGFLAVALIISWKLSRPKTIYDGYPGYILINSFTGIPALLGQVFDTPEAAMKAERRLSEKVDWAPGENFQIVYVSPEDLDHQLRSVGPS